MRRRAFVGLVGTGLAAAAAAGCGVDKIAGLRGQTGEVLRSNARMPKPFTVPLPIPPVKRPLRSSGSRDFYQIVQRPAEVEILPGLKTGILGYDGLFPGPTLAGRKGRPMVVRHRNELSVPTAVHLHGGHVPAASDGGPLDLILPHASWRPSHAHDGGAPMPISLAKAGTTPDAGESTVRTRDYLYPMNQRAATLWYHDHRMDFTGPQVYRGLAGFHLVRDDEEAGLDLPDGDREIPLMICDRAFEADGSFRYPAIDRTMQRAPGVLDDYMEGVLGDVLLVNGAPWPELEVEAGAYRFRILNASGARRFRLSMDQGTTFVQIGSDQGLLEQPVTHKSLDIASAERFDVIVDFSKLRPGTLVTLANDLGESPGTGQVMRFRVRKGGQSTTRYQVPKRLSRIEKLDASQAVRTRTWTFTRGKVGTLDGWHINGRSFDPERMDAEPRLGDVEIWRFVSDVHHPIHVHLDPFQVLARSNRGPGDYDAGWKDTVDVRPSEVVEVAIRFTDYTGPYLMHCHNLEHEDMAMMATFRTRR